MVGRGKLLLYVLVVLMLALPAAAAENFTDGWSPYTDSGTWITSPAGTTLSASIQGDGAWGNYSKYFEGAMGASATFNMASVTGLGAGCGIRKDVATLPSGNHIMAEVWLMVYNGTYAVDYQIRERDPDTSATIRTMGRGYIGSHTGVNWSVGQNIVLGVALVDNVISFYGSIVPDMLGQYLLEGPVTPLASGIQVYAWAEGDGAGTFSCSNLNVASSKSEFLENIGVTPSYTAYIPHLTGGFADWKDYLQVDNDSSAAAAFTLTIYDSTGTVAYSAAHSVAALTRSKTTLELKTLAADAQCGMITYSDPGLSFRVSHESVGSGGVAEFRLTDVLSDDLGFYFSDFAESTEWKGIALANIGPEAGSVTLNAIGGGAVLGTQVVSIGAYQKIIGVYQTWFPAVPFDQIEGIVAVSTVETTCGVSISGNMTNSQLLFTAGAPLE